MKIYNIKKSDLLKVFEIAKMDLSENDILEVEEGGLISFSGNKKEWVYQQMEYMQECTSCECDNKYNGYENLYNILNGYIGEDPHFINYMFKLLQENNHYTDYFELSDYSENDYIYFADGLENEEFDFYEDEIKNYLKLVADKNNKWSGELI